MYQTIDTDNNNQVISTGATRSESILGALRLLDLPDGYESYEDWLQSLESSTTYGTEYEVLGLATEETKKYQATVTYPRNPLQAPEVAEGATIAEAERIAIDASAVNVSRRVEVVELATMRYVKGPYPLKPVGQARYSKTRA